VVIVVVCPGQGSQTPGFLTPWLADTAYAEQLAELSDAAGIDLATHGTVSDADTIRDTAIAQPLIVAAGLLTLSALLADGRFDRIGGIAGHSVGEITAAAAAGVLTETAAMRFVAERGRAMADAAALEPTGMSAVLGADEAALVARLDELGLEPANFNGGGQIVVAGALDALDRLRTEPPAGARVIPLQVAGAFHTRYMRPAVERLAAVAADHDVSDPGVTL
jgi:[acyl-carrier-protein] S-malonyltransferase